MYWNEAIFIPNSRHQCEKINNIICDWGNISTEKVCKQMSYSERHTNAQIGRRPKIHTESWARTPEKFGRESTQDSAISLSFFAALLTSAHSSRAAGRHQHLIMLTGHIFLESVLFKFLFCKFKRRETNRQHTRDKREKKENKTRRAPLRHFT